MKANALSFASTRDQIEFRSSRHGGPQLFVVIASTGRVEQLGEGLRHLLPIARSFGAQVVVVGAATPNKVYDLTREHAGIRYIMTAPGLTRKDLLSRGVAETAGGVVLLTDDAVLLSENWSQLMATRLGLGPGGLPRVQDEIPA